MERVGFGKRLGAALIDGVIVIGIALVVYYLLGVSYLGQILQSLVVLGYLSTEIIKAATPGKMLLGIAIRNEDGTPATQETLIKRYVVKNCGSLIQLLGVITTMSLFGIIGGLAGLVIFIGCFFVLAEPRQAFHDKAAKTAVYPATAMMV